MTEVAGEVADGLLAHAFTTERYLREVTLPALERGLATSGRDRTAVEISYPGMVVTGVDDESFATAEAATRKQLAFYGSTPAYRPVLELHGWGDLQTELNTLSKRGAWDEMAGLIDDEMLHTFAVVGELGTIAATIRARFDGLADRFNLYAPSGVSAERWAEVLSDVRG
jgi:probable F420-dependent oxidoreductase